MILLSFIVIFLGGCQMGKDKLPSEMNAKDLPEGRAFENAFTREFIQSTKEVSPGYYPFLAQNGKYEMHFPIKGKTNDSAYSSKDNRETLFFSVSEKEERSSAAVTINYYSYYKSGTKDNKIEGLRTNIGLPLDFEEVSNEKTKYYIAPFEKKLHDGEFSKIYGFAAYIQNEKDSGGIDVIYTFYCEDSCEETKEVQMQEAYNLILSIEFLEVTDIKDDA